MAIQPALLGLLALKCHLGDGWEDEAKAYLTFRVMSEHSSGWIVPAKPGLHIARAIAQEVNKAVEDGIAAAGQ